MRNIAVFTILLACAFLVLAVSAFADAPYHDADTNQDNKIELSELLRVIQFFNMDGYHACPEEGTEDGFCPGLSPSEGEGEGEGVESYTVSLVADPPDAGTINFMPDSSETTMTVEGGTRVTIGATVFPGWYFNRFKIVDSTGHTVYSTINPFSIIVWDDQVVTAQFVLNYVSVPTISFRCSSSSDIQLSVRMPSGNNLHSYLVDPTIGHLNYVGVAGPNGNWVWDPETSPRNPDIVIIESETYWLIQLTTNFESWAPDHFRGNLFAVDDTGQMSFFDLSQWSVNYGLDDSVVVDDGSGELAIEFLRDDGDCY
ncbi:MAG: hypothetical protein WC668_01680 [Patescibacteria group bacterium]|jgi:hypothetical protein